MSVPSRIRPKTRHSADNYDSVFLANHTQRIIANVKNAFSPHTLSSTCDDDTKPRAKRSTNSLPVLVPQLSEREDPK